MEIEIELKLLTQADAGSLIESHLLPQLTAECNKREFELFNSYFDTPERALRRMDMGLRIRARQGEYEQTIKTAGRDVAGLHQRPEYNIAMGHFADEPPEFPQLSQFPQDIWPADVNVAQLQQALRCQFSTHFYRQVYLLSFANQAQVELVWDKGEIVAGTQRSPINEIELELKRGSIEQLFSLAAHICQIMPVKIGVHSKAARGYQLMQGQSANSVNQVSLDAEPIWRGDDHKAMLRALEYYLRQWQILYLNVGNTLSDAQIDILDSLLNRLQQLLEAGSHWPEADAFNGFSQAWGELRQQASSAVQVQGLSQLALSPQAISLQLQLMLLCIKAQQSRG